MKTSEIFKPTLALIINQYCTLELKLKQKEKELESIISDSDEKRYLQDEVKKLIIEINQLKEDAKAVERKLI